MAIAMQLEILSRETVKPSSPTPTHLKIHTLSLFDQLAPHMYVPLVFFYHHKIGGSGCGGGRNSLDEHVDKAESLRKSLSKTLSRYYPFAGRIKDKVSVDCNDEGVTFLEARLRFIKLSEVLDDPRSEILDLLFVDGLQWKDPKFGSLLAVQITFFDCGGFAIAVLLSHKLADTATMVTFMNHWALISGDNSIGEEVINPLFISAALFPHGDLPAMSGAIIEEGSFVCRRFVFDGSKIETLKSSISEKVDNPTRVEVVSALIYKTAIAASRSNSELTNYPTIMLQTLNLRTRVTPPLPESLVGSLVSFFPVTAAAGEREVEIHDLVGTMREKMAEFCNKYAKKYRTEEWLWLIKKRLQESREILSNNNQVAYRCSSGCRFRIYKVDFGWGEPTWVTMPGFRLKNTVMMLDTKNGEGIEALVSLEEKEMAAFEQNEELLACASVNPSANTV